MICLLVKKLMLWVFSGDDSKCLVIAVNFFDLWTSIGAKIPWTFGHFRAAPQRREEIRTLGSTSFLTMSGCRLRSIYIYLTLSHHTLFTLKRENWHLIIFVTGNQIGVYRSYKLIYRVVINERLHYFDPILSLGDYLWNLACHNIWSIWY